MGVKWGIELFTKPYAFYPPHPNNAYASQVLSMLRAGPLPLGVRGLFEEDIVNLLLISRNNDEF